MMGGKQAKTRDALVKMAVRVANGEFGRGVFDETAFQKALVSAFPAPAPKRAVRKTEPKTDSTESE